MFLVYSNLDGKAVSLGSVVANPLPDNLAVYTLTDEEKTLVKNGRLEWDASTRSFNILPEDLSSVNLITLEDNARLAINNNKLFLAQTSYTNADIVSQVKALTRQSNHLIRLVIGKDLLKDISE